MAKHLRKFIKNSSMTLMSLVFTGLIGFGCIYFYMVINLPDVNQLKDIHLQVPLRVYSADDKLIGEFGEKKRIPVTFDQVPPKLVQAILDTEDQRYYEHNGVDFIGLVRAGKAVLASGRLSQGASTITMQVARNYFFSPEKTFTRKINEILLALKIDSEFSKKEILELYLNKIYVGQRAYGVAAAAQIYYGKNLSQLTISEMAMIAGLPQAPSRDNPVVNPKGAIERRNHVLLRMYENGHLTKAEYKTALAAGVNDVVSSGIQSELEAPYLAEMVRNTLYKQLGDKIYDDGYKVYTTIDSHLQTSANKSLRDGLIKYDLRHGGKGASPKVEGALVALNTKNGAILALTGGFSYARSNFNRAIQSGRQSGSAFKPFIYSAALEKGYTLASMINDAPIALEIPGTGTIWKPQNDTQNFLGLMSLRKALILSQNLVSIRLLQAIGVPYAVEYVKRFGFDGDEVPATPSLALGTTAISPLKLAAGYAAFANGGYKIIPYFVERIEDRDSKILFQAKPPIVPNIETSDPAYAPRILTPQNAYLITNALKGVIYQGGTGKKALSLNRSDLAGKTGTTNTTKDAWFCGYNNDLVATVWVGYDQPQSLHEHAAASALPIWIDFMNDALLGKPEHSLPEPTGITTARIDPLTGKLARPNQKNAIFETFSNDTVPTEVAPEVNNQTELNPVDQNNNDEDSDDYSDSLPKDGSNEPLF